MPADQMPSARHAASVVAILMVLAGGAALAYARWTAPIAEGDRAVADGQLDRALAAYARAVTPRPLRRRDRKGRSIARNRGAAFLVRLRVLREGRRGAAAGGEARLDHARRGRASARRRVGAGQLGHEVRFRARRAPRRRAAQAAEDPAEPADAAAAPTTQSRRATGQARRMRLLRPDLINWWLAVPVLVAFWAIGVAYARAMRRRSPVAPRFAPLSRRSTPTRAAAILVCGVAAAAGLVFAVVRPQALLAARTPEYERQDVVFLLDRSASMRAHDVEPSRSRRATAELRNFLRSKPDTIDRIGLIGFADAAVVLSYLTSDIDSLAFYLDWIDEDPTTLLGTNLGAALRSARDVAQKDDRPTRKLFVLISDGEDYGAELDAALAAFREEDRRVHTIGI